MVSAGVYPDTGGLWQILKGNLLFRDGRSSPAGKSRTLIEDEKKQEVDQEKILVCHKCNAAITKDKQRINKEDKHLHTFFNPSGIVYELGCFRSAPGCVVHGRASREFSWFANHSWQIAFCGVCKEHLGWYFSSGQDAFFGLIINRLRET